MWIIQLGNLLSVHLPATFFWLAVALEAPRQICAKKPHATIYQITLFSLIEHTYLKKDVNGGQKENEGANVVKSFPRIGILRGVLGPDRSHREVPEDVQNNEDDIQKE